MKKMGGAAQAVALLLAVVSQNQGMRSCSLCDGPLTKCALCGHVHCDEPGCMPVGCAEALEEE